jgi:hypothetical protein
MNTLIKSIAVAATATIALSTGINANAGTTQGLKSCKAEIEQDSRMAGYKVDSRMDSLKVRGRYTNFEIDVRATATDGSTAEWTANCKTRSSGKVETLELAEVSSNSSMVVAEN